MLLPLMCGRCGLARGNRAGVEVLTFTLTQSRRRTSRSWGTLALCRRCLRELGVERYRVPLAEALRKGA